VSDKNLAILVIFFPLVIGFLLGGWYVHSNQEEIVPLAGDMYIPLQGPTFILQRKRVR